MQTHFKAWGLPHTCTAPPAEASQPFQNITKGGLFVGAGRSYGDNCLPAQQARQTTKFNQIIQFDAQTGLIEAESGVTLDQILQLCVPSGWFLPVTPGTRFITLGGAIANDVHGKNHVVAGNIGHYLHQIHLARSNGDILTLSDQHNSDLFHATIGGLGLTGCILKATLYLAQIPSSYLETCSLRFPNLDAFFYHAPALDQTYPYTVAWVDGQAKGNQLGRGVLMAGRFIPLPSTFEGNPFGLHPHPRLSVPFTPPVSLINTVSSRSFNQLYYHKPSSTQCGQRQHYNTFFYPLDTVHHWNRVYGPRGFVQYQAVIPEPHARETIREMLRLIAHSNQASFLSVLKRFGHHPPSGLLSFPISGITLAMDFPYRPNVTQPLFQQLDHLVLQGKGRVYPAKDAFLCAEHFQEMFPQWTELESYRDPAICSRQWMRYTGRETTTSC